jgi:hypothetical protein
MKPVQPERNAEDKNAKGLLEIQGLYAQKSRRGEGRRKLKTSAYAFPTCSVPDCTCNCGLFSVGLEKKELKKEGVINCVTAKKIQSSKHLI